MEKHREAQFLAKQQLLSDQLKVAKAHLDTLKAKCNRVEEYSGRICNVVSDRFTALKQSLDKKKEEMISRILDDSFRVKEELNGAMKSAELIIGKSLQVSIKVHTWVYRNPCRPARRVYSLGVGGCGKGTLRKISNIKGVLSCCRQREDCPCTYKHRQRNPKCTYRIAGNIGGN